MSDSLVSRVDSTAPDGYISIPEAIDRDLKNLHFTKKIGEYEIERSWSKLRAFLFKRKLRAITLNLNLTKEAIPFEYWITEEASSILISIKSGNYTSYYKSGNGQVYINLLDFQTFVDRHIHPLPPSHIPNDLVFISYRIEEDTAIPSTYVNFNLAMHMVLEHALSRDEEGIVTGLDYAKNELFELISTGKIRSFHIDIRGLVRPLRQEEWVADGPIQLQIESDRSHIDNFGKFHNPNPTIVSTIVVQTSNGKEFGEIIIPNKDLMSALSGSLEIDREKRGRPRDYDKEAFLINAFEIIWFPPGGVPESREVHIEEAIKRYSTMNNGLTPSKSWARPLINKIWYTMGFKGGEDPPS